MRRNIVASLALLLWGAGLPSFAVAQQPVKLVSSTTRRDFTRT